MRIVQLVNNLDMGGLERLVLDLAQCQLAAGHEAMIYSLTFPGRLAPEAEKMGIPVRAFGKGPGPHLSTIWKIKRQLRIDRPDVLHAHNHLVHHYGVMAAKLAGVPVVVNTRHRAEQRMVSNSTQSSITTESPDKKVDLIFKAMLPWTDSVVLISESTREFFARYRGVPKSKSRVILNGAHVERFFSVPSHPGASKPRIRFGVAARLVTAKDHFTLLRAFRIVAGEISAAELHIAGDGPLRESLESYARELRLADRVTFLGAVSDTPGFFSSLDIFVMSSLSEGLPIAILEAMAAGLPIVSTRAGGIEEAAIEGQNARLVAPADPGALAAAMIAMAQEKDLASIGALGRGMVKEKFRIEQTWEGYYKLFVALGAKP